MVEQTVKVRALEVNDPPRSTYIDHTHYFRQTGEVRTLHSWSEHTFDRLRWAHGEDRARAIAMGIDAATNADLKAWRELGQ